MNIYFDNAATTPLDHEVIELMYETSKNIFGNPSSIHSFGRKSRAEIEKSRKTIAKYLNASPLDIVFTSCGTESNNMILNCSIKRYDIQHLIISEFEHKCVLDTAKVIAEKFAIQLHTISVNEKGNVNLAELEVVLSKLEGNKLVSIMHANNEIGTMIDLKQVGDICKKYDAKFHSDTVQTMAHFPIDVKAINVNYLSGSAHKFHGPKGVGFVYMRGDSNLDAFINGGGQERSYRSGTENLISIVAIGKAFELANVNMESRKDHITEIKDYLEKRLIEEIEGISFNGDPENSLFTVLSCSFPPRYTSDMFLFNLDLSGIACSGGSACSSGAQKASHVLKAINHPEDRQTIRFSFSHFNTKKEVDYLIEVLKKM
jgi:cysteine desulfurase